MGNNQNSNTINLNQPHNSFLHYHKDDYYQIDNGSYTLWKRKQDGLQLFQQYTLFIRDDQFLQSYKLMCNLRTNHQHLVNVHYFTHYKHAQICGNIRKGIIMTQRIPKILSQIKLLPYSQALGVLDQVIVKFEILYENYGCFKPSSSMIGFQKNNSKFKIKIWHNSNFSQLIPQYPNFTSKAHMINQLVKCIQAHGIRPNHQLFSEFLNQVNNNIYYHGFQQLKLGLYRYCRKYKIDVFNKDFLKLKQKTNLNQKDKIYHHQIFDLELQNHTKLLKDKYINQKHEQNDQNRQNLQYYRTNSFLETTQNLKKHSKQIRFTYQSPKSKYNNAFILNSIYKPPDFSQIFYVKQTYKPIEQVESTMFNSSPNQTGSSGFKNSTNSFQNLSHKSKRLSNNDEILKYLELNNEKNTIIESTPNINKLPLINIGSEYLKFQNKQNKPLINPFKEHQFDQTPIKKCSSVDNIQIELLKQQNKQAQDKIKNQINVSKHDEKDVLNEKKQIYFNKDVVEQYYSTKNKKDNNNTSNQKQISSDSIISSLTFSKLNKNQNKSPKSWR